MPTQCFLVSDIHDPRAKEPVAMWPLKTGSGGKTYVVRLPSRGLWDVYSLSSTDRKPWQITGDAPNITAYPSIVHLGGNTIQGYHGWLTDGELSDDLERRTYP